MASVKPLMEDAEAGQTVAQPTPPEDVYAVCPIMHQNPQHLQIEFVGDQQTPMLAVSPDETTMKVQTCLEKKWTCCRSEYITSDGF